MNSLNRLAVISLAVLIVASPAHAATITLTGGDLGEGYAPLGSRFAALAGSNVAVQGVAFTTSDPHIIVGAPFTGTGAVNGLGPDPNDINLQTIMQGFAFGNTPFTVTITGLTPGVNYQLDSFLALRGPVRTEQLTAVGATTVTDTAVLGDGSSFDIRQVLLPDATGTIVETFSITSGFDSPFVNGGSVTFAPAVPEPASLILFGTGLLGAGMKRWRKRQPNPR